MILQNGARDANLVEHRRGSRIDLTFSSGPLVGKKYSVQWKNSVLDIAELAHKRFIEGWSLGQLSSYFGCSHNTIQSAYNRLRRRGYKHPQICAELRDKILESRRRDI